MAVPGQRQCEPANWVNGTISTIPSARPCRGDEARHHEPRQEAEERRREQHPRGEKQPRRPGSQLAATDEDPQLDHPATSSFTATARPAIHGSTSRTRSCRPGSVFHIANS